MLKSEEDELDNLAKEAFALSDQLKKSLSQETEDLKTLLEKLGINQTLLAGHIGISKTTFSNAMKNRKMKGNYYAGLSLPQHEKAQDFLRKMAQEIQDYLDNHSL